MRSRFARKTPLPEDTTSPSPRRRVAGSLAGTLDWLIHRLKWPVAVASVVMLPSFALAVLGVLREFTSNLWWLGWFAMGFAAFFPLWKALSRAPRIQRWAMTLEHELTHALFALLTLHPVSNLRVSWRGGSVTFVGQGNWLITLAPYFFCLAAFLLMPIGLLLPWFLWPAWQAMLGIALAYHVRSTVYQLHRQQTDLRQAGWTFSAMFLPTANLASLGSVLGFASQGLWGMLAFWSDALHPSYLGWP